MREKNSEKVEESERERVRRKEKKQNTFSIILVTILSLILCALGYLFIKEVMKVIDERRDTNIITDEEVEKVPETPILDDNGEEQISSRVKDYVYLIENDLKDLGYTAIRVVLPSGKMRELDIDIEGIVPYFKVNIDRDSAVTAEDISRMIKYLKENNLEPTYVDVRVEGKAFYK